MPGARHRRAGRNVRRPRARVDRNSKRVAFSVTRELASPPRIVYEIWDEQVCGGDPRKLAEDVASLSFAFDPIGRLVYFAQAGGGAVLLVRGDSGVAQPILGGCGFPNDQQLFVDVSLDGTRALVSRNANGDHEVIHYLGKTAEACGTSFTNTGPFADSLKYYSAPTRLSLDGKRSLRARIPANDCEIGTPVRDRSNDFLVYDFHSAQLVRGLSPQACATMRAVAFLPNGGFVSRYGTDLQVYDAKGAPVGKPIKDGLYDNGTGTWWLDVSPDGAWLVQNGSLVPSPF